MIIEDVKSVTAKFECKEVLPGVDTQTVRFSAVTSSNQGNEDFARYTPAGNLEIWISNNAKAATFFKVGRQYYLDFTAAEG